MLLFGLLLRGEWGGLNVLELWDFPLLYEVVEVVSDDCLAK